MVALDLVVEEVLMESKLEQGSVQDWLTVSGIVVGHESRVRASLLRVGYRIAVEGPGVVTGRRPVTQRHRGEPVLPVVEPAPNGEPKAEAAGVGDDPEPVVVKPRRGRKKKG